MAGNDFEVTKAGEAEVRSEEETRAVGEEDVWYGNATDVVLQDEVGVEGAVVVDRQAVLALGTWMEADRRRRRRRRRGGWRR